MSDRKPKETAGGPAAPREAETGDKLLDFADRLRRSIEQDVVLEEQPEIWVAFHLGQRSYALPVTHVREYAPVGRITPVPGAPPVVCGVASLRGHAIPIVDLKKVLGLSEGPMQASDHVLVTEQHGRLIGLLIDRIDQVVRLLPSKIKDASLLDKVGSSDKILGFYETGDSSLILLAAETFLAQESESPTTRTETS